MSVIIERDCIKKSDGSLVCWDKSTGKVYVVSKRGISLEDMPKEDLLALMKQATEHSGEPSPFTKDDEAAIAKLLGD